MNFRNLLLSVAAIAATPLFAATYYVTPEGAGSKDGSSWENAFDTEAFREKAANNENGDIYNFAGGVYSPSATIILKKETGAILNGNADGERTIFTGDKNGNNVPENGDASRLIRFEAVTADKDQTKPIEINNIDFTCVYTSTTDASQTVGALMIENSGNVKVNKCNFYNNLANGTQGGAPCHLNRSTVKFTDCIFHNNRAKNRGAAIRLKSNEQGKGFTTFENCVFKNNTIDENLGIIFIAHSTEVNIINCTITDNKSNGTVNAATIFSNPKNANYANQLTIVNSTIAGNTPSQIGFNGKGANLRMVNSVIVGAEGTNAFDFNASEDFANVISGGYNYAGPVAVGEFWQDTDTHGEAYNYASIYGTKTLNADNQLVPATYVAGASGEQVKTATAEWGLPAEWNLATDAAGTTRETGMTPGANAYTQAQIDGGNVGVISTIDDAALKLVKAGNGVYTIEGTTEGITVYTVNGATVAASSNNIVDLSAFANGLYILKSGNAIFKVIK